MLFHYNLYKINHIITIYFLCGHLYRFPNLIYFWTLLWISITILRIFSHLPHYFLLLFLFSFPLLSGGYFHGINNLTYGVDIDRIRWMGILQVCTFDINCFGIVNWRVFQSLLENENLREWNFLCNIILNSCLLKHDCIMLAIAPVIEFRPLDS